MYRIDSDGTPVPVASGMANDGSAECVDPYPLFGTCVYRVVATDPSSGSQSVSEVPVKVKSPGVLVQWPGGSVTLPFNLELKESYDPDVVTLSYAGRRHPVGYFGTEVGQSASWRAQFPKSSGDAELSALRALAGSMSECHVREPMGTGYPAIVKVNGISTANTDGAVTVDLEVTRVDG